MRGNRERMVEDEEDLEGVKACCMPSDDDCSSEKKGEKNNYNVHITMIYNYRNL